MTNESPGHCAHLLSRIGRTTVAALLLFAAHALQAFGAPGDLDPSFGTNGYWTPAEEPGTLHYFDGYYYLDVDSLGRIYGIRRLSVDRVTPNGAADSSFGSGGTLQLPTAIAGVPETVMGYRNLKVAAGEKFFVTAMSCSSPSPSNCRYTLLRFNSNGTEDLRKIDGGWVDFTYPDGRYFASGMRYLANGDPDPSFTGPPVGVAYNEASRAPDGSIFFVRATSPREPYLGEVHKRRADGTVDTSFGGSGVVTLNLGGNTYPARVMVQRDNKVVVLGYSWQGTGFPLFVARLLPTGSLDTAFGQGGVTGIPGITRSPFDGGLAIQLDGKIVVASNQQSSQFAFLPFVARLLESGSIDPAFAGGSGIRYLDPMPQTDLVESMVQTPDLSIIVGMSANLPPRNFGSDDSRCVLAKLIGLDVLAISPPFFAAGAPSRPYTQRLSASGGVGPYTFSLIAGSLPPGLSLSGDTISGTPTVTGSSTFTIQVRDNGGVGTRSYNIQIHDSASLVASYYSTILGRMPDSQGQAYWQGETNRMTSLGIDPGEVFMVMAGSFFNGPEYAARNRQGADFITDLYNTFFGRTPDSPGLNYWVGQLQLGKPKAAVLNDFLLSPEFSSYTRAIFGTPASRAEISMVVDFYRGLLGRLPDNAGFSYWVGVFRNAQCAGNVVTQADAISAQFLTSQEYTNRDSARQFVDRTSGYVIDLYNAFVRRGSDLAGFQYWRDQIDSGARTRENVRQQLVVSPEFQQRVSAVQAQGC